MAPFNRVAMTVILFACFAWRPRIAWPSGGDRLLFFIRKC